MAHSMLPLWPYNSSLLFSPDSLVLIPSPTLDSGLLLYMAAYTGVYGPVSEVVPQEGSPSMDMEITDGSFHASFVAMR